MSVKKCFLVPLDLAGNEILNFVVQKVTDLPGDLWEGRLVYDATERSLKYSKSDQWVTIADEQKILDIIKSDEKIIASALTDLNLRLNNIVVPTKVSELENDSDYQTLEQVTNSIDTAKSQVKTEIIAGASEEGNTLEKLETKITSSHQELSDIIDENEKVTSTAITALNTSISDNKAELIKIIEDDEEVISAALNDLDSRIKSISSPTKVSDLRNDANYQTLEQVESLIVSGTAGLKSEILTEVGSTIESNNSELKTEILEEVGSSSNTNKSEILSIIKSNEKVSAAALNDLDTRLSAILQSLEPYVITIDDTESTGIEVLASDHEKGLYPTVMLLGASGKVLVCATTINEYGDITLEWELDEDYPIKVVIKK